MAVTSNMGPVPELKFIILRMQRFTAPYPNPILYIRAGTSRLFQNSCSVEYRMFSTKELAHLEIIGAIVYQLTKGITPEEVMASGFEKYYVDHTAALWPQAAGGIPFNACEFQSKGDPITDLMEDMAAEQKARTTYDNILRLVKDPEICDPIRFLREREVVHFQRFGEALRTLQDELNHKNFYAFNPSFDCPLAAKKEC